MRDLWRFALALAAFAWLTAGFAACGGGDSDDSTAATTQEPRASATAGGPASDPGEGSASFRTPGGDNSIQNFGEEADAAEVAAATVVLAGYLQARSGDEWAEQCSYLAKAAVAPLEQLASRSPQFKGKGCAAVLSGLMAGTPPTTRADSMTDGIASLRVEGNRGFALYHGAEGIDYFVTMVKEDGEWKVGALAPSEFP